MKDKNLYERLLGIERPWRVHDVDLQLGQGEVRVSVELVPSAGLKCPTCGADSSRYDARRRRWRHLDTMQYRTIVEAEVPRVRCDVHGVVQVDVPWAEKGSRFTALFEALVIDWLHEASFAAVARQLKLTWDQVAGIRDRAVKRGLARREIEPPSEIGVDETSFKRRHDYVTSVIDLERDRVLYIGDGRTQSTLDAFYEELGESGRSVLESVAMDMWPAYINSTQSNVPHAKIVFDKFHIAKHLGDAVDYVRRLEHRSLTAEGDRRLVRTKYIWLMNPDNMSHKTWRQQHLTRCTRMGNQGVRDDFVGICEPWMGRADVEALVQLGNPFAA